MLSALLLQPLLHRGRAEFGNVLRYTATLALVFFAWVNLHLLDGATRATEGDIGADGAGSQDGLLFEMDFGKLSFT